MPLLILQYAKNIIAKKYLGSYIKPEIPEGSPSLI